MLYIFHVDSGKMMRFDMNLALESVGVLKENIQEVSGIPADKQVLLISGGESLDPNKRVCSYSAGTDTNPIFLFSRSVIECATAPPPVVEHTLNEDLQQKVRDSCDLPVTLSTVTKRAQLAQRFHELARDLQAICENLVHDQHLQQQGWSAVLANLEDIVSEFRKRLAIFEKTFKDYMDFRDTYINFLSNFNHDLEKLQRIPVLTVLLELEKQNTASGDGGDNETSKDEQTSTSSSCITDASKEITLYEWISSSDDRSTLDQVYEHCQRGLEQFDEQVFTKLKDEIDELVKNAESTHMKEIKGLGERLFGLDQLMRDAKTVVRQQGELAQAFANNQTRANNTKDTSVLPDLCISHKKQMVMMSHNHQQLCDIKRRCVNSKNELSSNLHTRLRWVMFIEQQMVDSNHKLIIYHENLKRLQRYLEVLQQIHLTPTTYFNAVVEVVRRREFSQAYLLWSSELACHLLTIHNEEVARRKEFQAQFDGHFLNSLFPGLDDLPPSFATQAPSLFDTSLPKITEEDVERLKRHLPDLADHLHVPDISAITNFFLIKSVVKKDEEKHDVGSDKATQADENVGEAVGDVAGSNLDCEKAVKAFLHLKDLDRGCESETDTEEFEKVGQSPLELNFDNKNLIPSPRARTTQEVATLTEDNLQNSRSEQEKLTAVLIKLQFLSKEGLGQLRLGLSEIKSQVLSDRNALSQSCESLSSSWENLIVERDSKEKETINNLKKDHQREINEYKTQEEGRNKEIQRLHLEKDVLEHDILKTNDALRELKETFDRKMEENLKDIEELQKEIQEKDLEREKSIKETTDRLNRDHKAEIENIRSRFKLMTMERSPSDTSLEKSGDFSSLPSHTTLLMQMTENFEMDKERAVNEALVKERSKWEKILDIKIQNLEAKFESEKEQLVRNICEEKEQEIDVLRERERNLNLECLKYKDTIQQLAETERETYDSDLMEKINILQKEKEILEEELERIKSGKSSGDTSYGEGKVDVTTSPIKEKESTSSSSKSDKIGRLNIDQCKTSDHVLVLWDQGHENFRVLQENKHMYFLHSDSLETLGLEINDGNPNKMYCVGEVVDKEYCHARKSENRYKVPKGTKFFRVKLRPVHNPSTSKDLSQTSFVSSKTPPTIDVMSQSQSIIGTMFESTVVEKFGGSSSLPSSPPRYHPVILENDEPTDADLTLVSAAAEHLLSDVEQVPDVTSDILSTEQIEVTTVEQPDVATLEHPEIHKPDSVEQHFAEDSGIVESIEQAQAALDDYQNECETSDR